MAYVYVVTENLFVRQIGRSVWRFISGFLYSLYTCPVHSCALVILQTFTVFPSVGCRDDWTAYGDPLSNYWSACSSDEVWHIQQLLLFSSSDHFLFYLCRYRFIVFIIFPSFFTFNPGTIIVLPVFIGGVSNFMNFSIILFFAVIVVMTISFFSIFTVLFFSTVTYY